MTNNANIIFILFISIIFNVSHSFIISDYYNSLIETESAFDEFITDTINEEAKSKSYYFIAKDNGDKIYFDFQSEFGCVYITLDGNNYTFCAEGKNSLFIIDQNLTKGTHFNITVGYSKYEKIVMFDFSLKVSSPKIKNVMEISIWNKMLCKTHMTTNGTNICLFIIRNDKFKENKDLIVYANTQDYTKQLKIYADYIIKNNYDEKNQAFFEENIPNVQSQFTNNGTDMNFIIIPNLNKDNYTYLCIESKKEDTIEIITQSLEKNDGINIDENMNLQIFQLTEPSHNIDLNIIKKKFQVWKQAELTFVALYGKTKFKLNPVINKQYINDIKDNKVKFLINIQSSLDYSLIVNNLNVTSNGIGCIFYITYKKWYDRTIQHIDFDSSNKYMYQTLTDNQIILYSKLPKVDKGSLAYNVNFQIYHNIKEDIKVQTVVSSQKEVHQYLIDKNISLFTKIINSTFNKVFSAVNIYLSDSEIPKLKDKDNWLLVIFYINENFKEFVFGSTILQVNSLLYPSERIYHYGCIGEGNKRVVYRLRAVEKYHLMRVEFSSNDEKILWSVKRTNNETNYMKNDTDLSFVTEKYANGREILTLYIEHGEDIYLSIYLSKKKKDSKYSNYVFKYINSASNLDFKNYIVKNDNFTFSENGKEVMVRTVKKISSDSTAYYYVTSILEAKFVKSESLNTIGLLASPHELVEKGRVVKNLAVFDFYSELDKSLSHYISAYAKVISNDNDIEHIAYTNYRIEGKTENKVDPGFIIASICIAGVAFIIMVIRLIRLICKECCYFY